MATNTIFMGQSLRVKNAIFFWDGYSKKEQKNSRYRGSCRRGAVACMARQSRPNLS